MRPLQYGPSDYAISHRPKCLRMIIKQRPASSDSERCRLISEWWGLHLSRIRAALYCVLLVSSHPMSVCSHQYGIFVPSRRTNCSPPRAAGVGASARVQAAETCQSQGRDRDRDFGLLILTLTRPSRVFMRQLGHHRVLVRRWTELVEDK